MLETIIRTIASAKIIKININKSILIDQKLLINMLKEIVTKTIIKNCINLKVQ